jgi:hypothetical protein
MGMIDPKYAETIRIEGLWQAILAEITLAKGVSDIVCK